MFLVDTSPELVATELLPDFDSNLVVPPVNSAWAETKFLSVEMLITASSIALANFYIFSNSY